MCAHSYKIFLPLLFLPIQAVVVIAFLVLIFRMMHSWNRGVTDPSVSVAKHRDQLRRQAYMGVIISSATWMYTWSARYFLLSVLFRRLFVALLYGMGTSPRLQVLGVLIVLFLHIGLLKFFRPYRLHQVRSPLFFIIPILILLY